MSAPIAHLRAAVILHGHGASPGSYAHIADALAAATGLEVTLPPGPVSVIPEGEWSAQESEARAWWDEPDEGPGPEAVEAVRHALQVAGRGEDASVVLVGFSQGAAMATVVAHVAPVGAVVLIAGFLPEPRPDAPLEVALLSIHDDDDEIVDAMHTTMAVRWMARQGAVVTRHAHCGGHAWTPAVTAAIADWLREQARSADAGGLGGA